jgi:hypothetical protein
VTRSRAADRFNDSGEDALIFAYGAPAESKAQILDAS